MISWLMDRLDNYMQQGKPYMKQMPDPNSISNNAYNQWGPVTSAANVNVVPSTVNGICGTITTNAVGIGVPIAGVAGQHTPMWIPSPSGLMYTMCFTDATGSIWALSVDQAYLSIMQQISVNHQFRCTIYQSSSPPIYVKPKPLPMLEGDFSYDEMELAETIIEELESG